MHATIGAAGALLGGGFGILARRQGPRGEVRAVAAGLVVAALIYVGFALARGAGARWVAIEAAGVAGFGAVALLGVRAAPLWLAAGWALHVAWDVALHSATGTPFVPFWYPPACVGFDLVVALWIAARWRALSPARG